MPAPLGVALLDALQHIAVANARLFFLTPFVAMITWFGGTRFAVGFGTIAARFGTMVGAATLR